MRNKLSSPLFSIWLFNLVLIGGLIFSQIANIEEHKQQIFFFTDIFLAYIMMIAGLEYSLKEKKEKPTLPDGVVASLAAALPWLLCFLYFQTFGTSNWKDNLLLSRFAAPTAAGSLITLLSLAGFRKLWIFKKIENLVILEDLDTIIFLIPLQFLLYGNSTNLIITAIIMNLLIFIGLRYPHQLILPMSRPWLLLYSLLLTLIAFSSKYFLHLETEIILPAFVLGILLYNRGHTKRDHFYEHDQYVSKNKTIAFDRSVYLLFLLLIGLSLPKITINMNAINTLALHVLLITFLMNLGKMVPTFFYRNEATLKERVALSIGMMPRGEMGAGILAIALIHGVRDTMAQAATLSLAFNFLFTGFFIWTILVMQQHRKN